MILIYVGVLDFTHDLDSAIRALGTCPRASIELHVVGDGRRREEYARTAKESVHRSSSMGASPHEQVPPYITAADLCLAPYDPSAFASGELGYATMKIPEYLSVGRPVVSVPSGRIRIVDPYMERPASCSQTRSPNWTAFLADLPSRERLHDMGKAAAGSKLPSWDDTAVPTWRLPGTAAGRAARTGVARWICIG